MPTAPLALGEERPSYDNRPGRVPPRRLGRDEAPLPVAIDQRSLPREPPFMAFVGNLTYDATEEDIRSFFAGIEVTLRQMITCLFLLDERCSFSSPLRRRCSWILLC